MTFDEIRKRHPQLGFAVYALTPGENVTLEILTVYGETKTYAAPTEAEAIAQAFPPGSELPAIEPVKFEQALPSIFD